jgi:hypothetical protein
MPDFEPSRRRILKGGLAAGSLLLPLPSARAQSEGAANLLLAPKLALVLGNGGYKSVPGLINPVNDARAITEVLKSLGFEVIIKLDAGRDEMLAAIQAYTKVLGGKKAVGLFYYAGHGLQLAWRNYLVPVDAEIGRVEDVTAQCVDIARLIEGIGKASNPMNVIVLDACRDNPFSRDFREAQKGLSQMDAPTATLLAYATSPGNVASDGEGANGLYTEFLLKELTVRETRIEDVFKRVRLGVRRRTGGAQIPWESTSLEEDFWFIPPQEVKELSERERDARFETELAQWERIKDAKDPAPLEAFLSQFPSGSFAELAQLQLDRALAHQGEQRIRIASQEGNPFTKGSVEADTRWKVGDSYTYRYSDLLTNAEGPQVVRTVSEITDREVRYTGGIVTDLLGNVLRRGGGRIYSPNQFEPLEYFVGKQWTTQFRITTPKGATGRNELDLRIVGREPVTVPAGTFNAFRIEGHGLFEVDDGRREVTTLVKWVAPDRLRGEIKMEETREWAPDSARVRGQSGKGLGARRGARPRESKVTKSQRWELVSFRQT